MHAITNRLIVLLLVIFASSSVATANEHVSVAPRKVFDFVDEGGDRPAVVSSVAMSGDGRWLAAAGDDHIVRVYDVRTLSLAHRLAEHRDWVRGVAFSADGQRLVSVGNDHARCVFNSHDGQLIASQRGGAGPLRGVAFDSTADRFATVGFHTRAAICDTNGTARLQFDCPCRDTCAVAIAPDGSRMAVGGRNGIVRIFDLVGSAAPIDIAADTRRIRAVVFSPDNRQVAIGGDGNEVKFFDATSGTPISAWPTRPAKVFSLLYLGSDRLAIGGSDNTIHIWNTASQTIERQLVGHTGTITSLATDASGQLLVSGSFDTTVRLWDLKPTAGNLAADRDTTPVR